MRVHTLKPFAMNQNVKQLQLEAALRKVDGFLDVEFSLQGMDDKVFWPDALVAQMPREGLWQSTCFEVFVNYNGSQYIEWNLSPSKEWYAYAFNAYRDPQPYILDAFRPDAQDAKEFKKKGVVVARIGIDRALKSLGVVDPENTKLAIGLSAVIKVNGELSYWALKHSAEKPDFHRRESFTIEL